MHVVELLQHHLVGVDRLRVVAFLPELISAARLVLRFASLEQVQEPGAPLGFKLPDQLAGGKLLQICHHPW